MKNLFSLVFLTFTLFLSAQNSPVANDSNFTVIEGNTYNANLTGSDDDSDPLTYTVVGAPTSGTLTIETNGSFSYIHSGAEGTSDSFTFKITDDENLTSNTATVTITVTPVNDAPTLADISKTIDEGASSAINVSGNDPEGTILEYTIVTAPSNGTFTLDKSTGVGYYTHNGGETTSDAIVVKAKESTGDFLYTQATITITITAVNDAPVSPDGTITVNEGSSSMDTSFGVSDADTDIALVTVNVTSQGSNGTAVVTGTNFVYTHDGSETTTDSFTYNTSDGALSTLGTITVTISPTNDAPIGVADTYYVTRNSTTDMSAEVGVLRNDTDSDSDTSLFTATLGATTASFGQVNLNSDGSFTYVTDGSNTTFNTDSFSYTVSDGTVSSAEVTVTLEVAEILPVPNSYTNTEGGTLTVDAAAGVVTNDIEPNSLSLTASVVANPSYGTLTFNADGSFSYVHDGSENRKDVFTYKLVNANEDESKSTFVVITNSNVNDAPTSGGSSLTLNEGATSIFTPTYTDTDTELSGIIFTITTETTNGLLAANLVDGVADGTYTYTHNGGETISDSFVYSVSDGEFTIENIAAAITVSPVNDAPTATALEGTVNEGGNEVITFAGTDPEGSTLDFVVLTNPTNGSISTVDGVTTYTHNGSETKDDLFTYASYDGTVQSAAATVTLTITPVNSAPVVTAVALAMNEGAVSTFNLATTSTEPEGQTMTYAHTIPTNGSITAFNATTGEITYTHDGSETTSDTFTYTAIDADTLSSASGTVTVTLTPVNDKPVINSSTVLNVDQFDELTFNIPAVDDEGDTMTYTIVTNPTKGELVDNGNGNFTYYNNGASADDDTFTVKANDGTEDSDNTDLTLTVGAINTTLPQILLTSTSNSITETDAGSASLAINAVLISTDFYSEKRDMKAAEVAVGDTNSLGYIYIGEHEGHKYYFKNSNRTSSDASSDAATQEGYLWTIESAAESAAVRTLLQAQNFHNRDIWLGYNYDYSDKSWKWVNGHTLTAGNFVIGSVYKIVNLGDTTQAQWNATANTTGVTYAVGSTFTAATIGTGTGTAVYENFGGSGYNATESSGFLMRPVVYANNSNWYNTQTTDYAYVLLEYDNNVKAGSDITFAVAATGTADENIDYELSGAGTITIASGSSTGSLTLTEKADTIDESLESVILTASTVSTENAIIKRSKNSLTVNIIDNELTTVGLTTPSDKLIYGEADGSIVITAEIANIKPFDTALTLALSGDATIDKDYSTDDDGYLELLATDFSNIRGMVQATSNDFYLAEYRKMFKVETDGTKTALGTGGYGSHNATNQPILFAKFYDIKSIAIDKASARSVSGSADVIYIADRNIIRKLDLGNNLVYFITGSNSEYNSTDGTLAEGRFRNIQDITVSTDGNTIYVIEDNKIRTVDLANGAVTTLTGHQDWSFRDGGLAEARFEGPRAIAMDIYGDLIVREYGKLRKIDIDGSDNSGTPNVTTLLRTNDWGWGDLFIDASNNMYFTNYDRHFIGLYSSDGEYSKVMNSNNASGTVDGVLKDAKISRPDDILISSSGNLIFSNEQNKLRKIDFINKLRIPAGQKTGTFTLNINNDSSYELDETINIKIASAESIVVDSDVVVLALVIDGDGETDGAENSLTGHDSAPAVNVVATSSSIDETGGSTILTFQLGDAGESGAKQDMSNGNKDNYIFLGTLGDHKYYMSYNSERWTDARDLSTDLGGYLVAIDSSEENTWIRDRMTDAGYQWNSAWIGYTDEDSEGKFEWANGSNNGYENWSNGEPNNSGGEDYTEILNNGKWNDLPNHHRQFIVEFSGSVSSLPTVITYTATESEAGEFTLQTVAPITIAAGASKATLTIAAVDDSDDEGTDTVTYTITDVTNGTPGSIDTAVVSINDDDNPTVTLTNSTNTFIENSGELVVTATIDNAKTFASSLGITLNKGGTDTAVLGKDYQVSELQNVVTFAGSGTQNYSDGTGILAAFNQPNSIVSDGTDIFVADKENNVIRKITSAGVVSTYAGNGNWAHDREEGAKTDVGFARPKLLAFNSAGEMFVFEDGRQRISKIDASGNVTKVIGEGYGDQNGSKTETQFGHINGMAFDSAGNLFVSDQGKIRKITFDPSSKDASSEAFAGTGNWGYVEGAGTDAEFREPAGIVVDASDNLYVADRHNHRIRKITQSGEVSTFAGDGHGYQDGSLLSARFESPYGLSIDSVGDIFVSTIDGNRIRKIDVSENTVSTVAGSGSYGFLDSDLLSSKFRYPRSILATSSAIYVADTDNHRIRKIDLIPSIKIPAGSLTGTLTLKGIDDFVYEVDESISVDVNSVTNVFNAVSDFNSIAATLTSGDDPPIVKLSVDDNILNEASAGTTNVTVSLSDIYSSAKIDMDASDKSDYYYLGTFKGSKYYSSKNNEYLNYTDAKAKAATLGGQLAIITSSGEQETIVSGIYAQDPEYSSSNPWLNHWIGLDFDDPNWIWLNGIVSDYENWTDYWQRDSHSRREAAYLHTNGLWHSTQERDHRRFVVEFSSAVSDSNTIVDISFTDANSSGTTLEGETGADFSSNLVSGKLTVPAGSSSGAVVLTAVDDADDEPIESFNVNLTSVSYNGTDDVDVTSDNTAVVTINDNDLTEITFAVENATDTIAEVGGQTKLIATLDNAKLYPVSVNLAFAESGDLIALFGKDYDSSDLNSVSTFSGSGNTGYLDGDAEDAEFSNNVRNMITDASGNIYVADMENRIIRKIDPQGTVSTFYQGTNWENELNGPVGMAFDSSGNMYVAEEWNNRISKIDTQGNLTRFANQDGQWGNNNGSMLEVRFEGVKDVVFDSSDNLYVLENHRIRKIEFSGDLVSSSDFVGSGNNGFQDGTGSDVRIGNAKNLVIDSQNNIYFADEDYQRIRKVTPGGVVTTIAGNGNWDFADGFGTNAKFKNPHTLAIDSSDNIYVSDRDNNRIRKLVLQSDGQYKVSTIAGDGTYGYVDGSADQSQFKQVTALAEFNGTLYAYDRDEYKFRKLLLNPVMSIPVGSKTASFDITAIDDNAYESTENIIVKPTGVGATLKSDAALTIKLTSNEATPKVIIKSESAVLNENAGTLTFDVVLVDAGGAASNWTNTELPAASAQDFDYMGEYNGRKYYFSKSYYTWTQAKENAERLGGQMLVIDDQAENDFVGSIMIRNGTWIGQSRPTEADSWTNIYGDVNFQNFQHVTDGGNISDLTGYAVTYGGQWYNNQDNDTRAYILEYGPVASSELESSVQLVYSGDANVGKDVDSDGNNINDYSTDALIATIAPNTQKTTVTLTGIDDSFEENIEEIIVTLALRTDPDDVTKVISNVDLGAVVSKTFQVSDDEEPKVSFTSSATDISENGGVATITASLSNPKLAETTVNLILEGTSTQLVDYEVSSIFGYKDFVGDRGNRGVSEGIGAEARFESPLHMIEYTNGSTLVYDNGSYQIKKIDSKGVVTNFLGKAYNGNSETGDANDVRINMNCTGQMVADLSNGDVYWTSCNDIYKFDFAANTVSKLYYYGDSQIRGIALYNNEIYFSSMYKYTINKLTYDGSNYSYEVVVGNEDNADSYQSNAGTQRPFTDNFHYYPAELIVDQARNKMYVNFYGILENWDYGRSRLAVIDFSNSSWVLHNTGTSAQLPNNGKLSTVMLDKASGSIFMTADNELGVYATDPDSGQLYRQDEIEVSQFGHVTSGAIVGSSLFVADYDNSVIGKINLGPSIDIPAGQTTGTIVLSAFKDPWFESDETIDVNVSSIANGFSDSTDAADVNILESTKLTLVESPFEGVENGKVSWGDYDRDGDMDLALMGNGADGTITNVYNNDGGVFSNTNQNFTKVIGGDIEFVDVNQDGWLDVAVSGNSKDGRVSKLYINEIFGFTESTTYSEQVVGLSQADMEWADVDNDSDPDLIISGIDSDNNFRTYYYTNIGNSNFFQEDQFNIQGFIQGEIDIVDKDNDGDNDLFITGISGSVGSQNYSTRQVDNTYYWGNNQTDVGIGYSNGNTEYLDIDGDGLLDYLSIGNQDINSTEVYSRSNLMDLNYLPKLNNTDFDFADYNNDGLSDVVISGEDESGVGITKLYVTYADYFGSNYQLVETDLTLVGLRESSVDWIDYDKDGDLDLFLTGLDTDGNPQALLYKAENVNNLNTPPSKVENVTVQGQGNNGTLAISWDKPSDDYSTSFRYSVRVGTSPGGSDILYSNSITDEGDKNGSTLLDISSLTTRTSTFLTVKPGTYYVSVQAIDGGNMGGKFSDEVSTTVDYAWNLQRLGGIIDRRLRTDESSSIKFMDLDKDGDKDLIGGNIGTSTFGKQSINVFAFQNDIFEPKRGFFNGVSSFEIADFNRDGNEDIIVGVEENQGTRVYLLLNTYDQDEARDDGYREYFSVHSPFNGDNMFNSVYNVKFAVKDLDNDGLVDVMAAGESSKISSEATAVVGILNIIPNSTESNDLEFNQFTLTYPKSIGDDKLGNLSFISFDFGDIDNDSDFDFLISGYGIDGYETILYENKRLLDENGAVVQPIEVYFEEKTTNFVSVKEGTTQFVDFDSDGKLDIIFSGQSGDGDVFAAYKNTGDNNFSVVTGIGLPKVRKGNFAFGDMFGRGVNDVIYSGTVSGEGTFSRIAYYDPDSFSYIDSGYDLFLDDADIGLADFDGDLDTDVVLTGKFNGDYSNYSYHGYVYMNVRGYDQGSVANSGSDDNIKTSSANGVKQTSSGGDASGESSLNSRPTAPDSFTIQRQRIAEDSYDVIISWNAGSDAETPADALTYSLKIGTSDGGEEILASGANANGVRNTGTAGNASTNKSWKITLPIGTYYVAVQAVDASFIGSEFSTSKEFVISTANKLGDSNGDESVNILDLTSNLDYILENELKVFVKEVADVNGDGNINVADISGIVNIILNDPGAAQGSSYDPYDWEYFSNKPVGDATLVRRDGKIFLENDKPVTSLQFSFDSSVEYELSEEMKNMTVVNFVKDGMRTFVIYSYNNQRIDDLTNVVFDYLDLNDGDDFEIKSMSAGTDNGLSLSLRYSDESFFDGSEDIIQIYPNPAVSNVNLLTDITKNVDNIEVDIYNVLGVSVYKTNIKSINRLNDLDVSMLSSGVYTVRVRMITDKNEEIINVHKLIKK